MPDELEARDIVIPIMIDIEIPVKVLEPPNMFRKKIEYMACKERVLKVGLETYIRKYRKYVPVRIFHIRYKLFNIKHCTRLQKDGQEIYLYSYASNQRS